MSAVVARSLCVSACLLDTTASPTKLDEPTKVQFGAGTRREEPASSRERSNVGGYLLAHGSRVVSVLDSGAEGPGSNRSRDAAG